MDAVKGEQLEASEDAENKHVKGDTLVVANETNLKCNLDNLKPTDGDEKHEIVKNEKESEESNQKPTVTDDNNINNNKQDDNGKSIENSSIEKTDNQEKANLEVEAEEEEEEDCDIKAVDDDDGDPIPSGTGSVSKDCSASELLGWSEILPKWHNKLSQRPRGLNSLVRNGIPDPLRGEVWQLLSGAQESADLMEKYRIFLTHSAPTEQIILRDVHRTYPAHENFRSDGGSSSLLDSLFKVCKAYAVYDEEVGYCQGLSFLVAALLLHMPEEQAFCVFVRIMQHYGLRNLFRNNFDELYLKFYQLEHLLEEHMPDLHQHFTRIGIEPFTYASQWFLTVFTAKFPLNAVFYIMDIFLLDGMDTIFQIALALLGASKQELLQLDFEGILKYFRVQMPKRYRNQENVQQLINASSTISLKRLKKHAKNYELVKQKEKLLENPITRLQRDNAKLTENNLRLEQENDDLARDLVASKIQLRAQLDMLEDKLIIANQDKQTYLNSISDMEDEKARLEVEVNQLKEVCRRELQRAESELTRDSSIIADYKKICSQLSRRLDGQLICVNSFIVSIQDLLQDNSQQAIDESLIQLFQSKANELIKTLNSDQQVESETAKKTANSPRRQKSNDSEQSTINRPVGAYIRSIDSMTSTGSSSSEVKIQHLNEHIDDLEVELARTKLALVEAECKNQQLTHELNVGVAVKSSAGSSLNQLGAGLASKLELMKAAVSSKRGSPKSAAASSAVGNTFTKLSERITNNISGYNAANVSPSCSMPTMINSTSSSGGITSSNNSNNGSNNNNNNNTTTTIHDQYQNQC